VVHSRVAGARRAAALTAALPCPFVGLHEVDLNVWALVFGLIFELQAQHTFATNSSCTASDNLPFNEHSTIKPAQTVEPSTPCKPCTSFIQPTRTKIPRANCYVIDTALRSLAV
jgi:hypothetical protein